MKLDLPEPGAGHEQMRHLRQVGRHKMPFDVFAHAGEHGVGVADRLLRTQHIAQMHDLAVGVGDFDADRAFAGDWRQDAHVRTGDGVGNVLLQVRDFLDLHALAELHLVLCDRGAAQEPDDLRVDLELFESVRERADHLVVLRCARRMGLAFGEHGEVGQLVRPIIGFGACSYLSAGGRRSACGWSAGAAGCTARRSRRGGGRTRDARGGRRFGDDFPCFGGNEQRLLLRIHMRPRIDGGHGA